MIKFGFSSREYVILHENSAKIESEDETSVSQKQTDTPSEQICS